MTLWEALLACAPADEATELSRLGPGYGRYQMIIIGAPETEHDRTQARYSQYRARAEEKLRAKLGSGELLATGRDPRDPFAPRQKIDADRWPHVKIDFERAALEAGQVPIIEVEISRQGGLHMNTSFKRGRLGIIDLDLSGRSYDLLLTLAEGAQKGVPFVSLKELVKKHFDKATNDKALGQGIEHLRIQLGRKIGRQAANALIVNVPRQGYRLNIPATEVRIED